MSSIDILRENLKEIKDGNIVRLICDVFLANLDNIRDFDPTETYYRNSIVYKKDTTKNKHQLLVCKKPSVTGAFNADDWDVFSFKTAGSAAIFECTFSAPTDGVAQIKVNHPLFDPSRDGLVLYHSVRGRLVATEDWNLNVDDGTLVDLQGFNMNAGETMIFEIIK